MAIWVSKLFQTLMLRHTRELRRRLSLQCSVSLKKKTKIVITSVGGLTVDDDIKTVTRSILTKHDQVCVQRPTSL